MRTAERLTIDDLRTFVRERLPNQGESIDIPIGMIFRLGIAITVQKELQAKGYRAHCVGKGNGLIIRIEHPQTRAKPQIAFST